MARVRVCKNGSEMHVGMTSDENTHVCFGKWTNYRSRAPRELRIDV